MTLEFFVVYGLEFETGEYVGAYGRATAENLLDGMAVGFYFVVEVVTFALGELVG